MCVTAFIQRDENPGIFIVCRAVTWFDGPLCHVNGWGMPSSGGRLTAVAWFDGLVLSGGSPAGLGEFPFSLVVTSSGGDDSDAARASDGVAVG